MQLKRVVFPAPFGPMSPTISHWSTRSVTLPRACTPPNAIDTPSISRTDIFASGRCTRPAVDHREVEAAPGEPVHQRPQLLADPTGERDEREYEQARADGRDQQARIG